MNLLELVFNSAHMWCIYIHSLVACIFGVNMPHTWNQNHPYTFNWASWGDFSFSSMLGVRLGSQRRYNITFNFSIIQDSWMFKVFSVAFLMHLLWWSVTTPITLSSIVVAVVIIMQNMKFMDLIQSPIIHKNSFM